MSELLDADAALAAEYLLDAFAREDVAVLAVVEEPSPEVVAALLMFATFSIQMLAEAHPSMSEEFIRRRIRRKVAELLNRNADGEVSG